MSLHRASLLLIAALFFATPAGAAGLTRDQLREVGFHLRGGTHLPAATVLQSEAGLTTLGAALDGKPALIAFTDYRCQSLCGVVIDQLAELVPRVPLKLGKDYNIISLALDGHQTIADVRTFWAQHAGGSPLLAEGKPFANEPQALAALERSVGLVAPFDADHRQFAHPSGLVLVNAAGDATRIVSPFAINPLDLRLALTEVAASPSLVGHALLLCYGFNPASGLYTLRIERVLSFAALLTIVVIGSGVLIFLRVERRRVRGIAGSHR